MLEKALKGSLFHNNRWLQPWRDESLHTPPSLKQVSWYCPKPVPCSVTEAPVRVANQAFGPCWAQALGGFGPVCLPFQLEELFHNSCRVNRKCYRADLNPCHGLNTNGNEELTLAKQLLAWAPVESLSIWRWGQVLLQEAGDPESSPVPCQGLVPLLPFWKLRLPRMEN